MSDFDVFFYIFLYFVYVFFFDYLCFDNVFYKPRKASLFAEMLSVLLTPNPCHSLQSIPASPCHKTAYTVEAIVFTWSAITFTNPWS